MLPTSGAKLPDSISIRPARGFRGSEKWGWRFYAVQRLFDVLANMLVPANKAQIRGDPSRCPDGELREPYADNREPFETCRLIIQMSGFPIDPLHTFFDKSVQILSR